MNYAPPTLDYRSVVAKRGWRRRVVDWLELESRDSLTSSLSLGCSIIAWIIMVGYWNVGPGEGDVGLGILLALLNVNVSLLAILKPGRKIFALMGLAVSIPFWIMLITSVFFYLRYT